MSRGSVEDHGFLLSLGIKPPPAAAGPHPVGGPRLKRVGVALQRHLLGAGLLPNFPTLGQVFRGCGGWASC